MSEQTEIDTLQRLDYYINRVSLYDDRSLRAKERRDLELLLRRFRKRWFGSALTDDERAAGRSEINP
jgi:hypothetical protein